MKLHLDRHAGLNVITDYDDGYVLINQQRHRTSVIVLPRQLITDWENNGFDTLQTADFERLRDLQPEIVLLGTGTRQRFPAPALLRPLIEARIGYEIMNTGAACRTYNILMGEGRNVAAALLFA